jgi:CRISPR-associated protein Csb1
MSTIDLSKPLQPQLLSPGGPVCWVITALLKPVGGLDRFQPAGFPEIGHVIYDAPRVDDRGLQSKQKVCIVDSAASMANHLETVCLDGAVTTELRQELDGLPRVTCVTDSSFSIVAGEIAINPEGTKDSLVATTLTEGHRLASDYFLDAKALTGGRPEARTFREVLREEFKIVEVKRDKTYFIPPATWWQIYKTIFKYDPNSLVHGVMFAKEQIKISRLLTAHLEAFGASRVGRSGVKFDRLGKTTSGQPIFSVDEETAQEIRATFVLDIAMLRSYGRSGNGLDDVQKTLLLDLALWKISQLLTRPFRYRTQCFLACESVSAYAEHETPDSTVASSRSLSGGFEPALPNVNISASIAACKFGSDPNTRVYYPADELFKAGKDAAGDSAETDSDGDDDDGDG